MDFGFFFLYAILFTILQQGLLNDRYCWAAKTSYETPQGRTANRKTLEYRIMIVSFQPLFEADKNIITNIYFTFF